MNFSLHSGITLTVVAVVTSALLLTGCGDEHVETARAKPTRVAGTPYTLRDTSMATTFQAAGVAEPVRQATLATKLMGRVTEVLVREGDTVKAGQPLVRIDARELQAKAEHVAASLAEATAVRADAATNAKRIRALYADSAAARLQLDAAETALARAEAGLATARAAAAELDAVRSYSVIRAPFAGVVTARHVDPGAFAAPGAPLVSIQDAARLRITAAVTPDIAQRLRRGDSIDAAIEGRSTPATVEGVVPRANGNLYSVNALVPNSEGEFLPGSAATLSIALGSHRALVVPARAIARQGDLTGVTLRTGAGDELRWVRLGDTAADIVEVTAGLRAGDQIVIPNANRASAEGME
ncbi:MAG TPA: efflux RND transporter periplasmic adaptor subunit [Gemmatimonadaceae bacterium]|nr:efflux RND transporter periplasmic adaptor subunit [Gemmatimonadaceae bacterium]